MRSELQELKGDSHQIWRTQRIQVNVASLRLFLRSSTRPNRAFEPQSLGRVRDPVRIAEGPTHDFGFSILDCGLKQHESHCRKRLRGKRGSSSIAFMRGSGRGHAFSDTWETWMVAKVLNPVPRKRGGWGDQDQDQDQGQRKRAPTLWGADGATRSLVPGKSGWPPTPLTIWDFLAPAAEPGGQSGQFAPQRRRVAGQQPQRNT